MPNQIRQEIAKEVECFYHEFMDAFNRQEIVNGAKFVDLPYALISGDEGMVVCSTESEHQRLSAQIFTDLKARGGRARISTVFASRFLPKTTRLSSPISLGGGWMAQSFRRTALLPEM